MKRFLLLLSSILLLSIANSWGQNYTKLLNDWIQGYETQFPDVGKLRITDVKVLGNSRQLRVYGNSNFQSLPFRNEMISQMVYEIDSIVSPYIKGYKVIIYADKVNVNSLVPNYYRNDKDKDRLSKVKKKPEPFIQLTSRPYTISSGLADRNIALWASHGWYYDQRSDRWRWQRARLFNSVEDKLPLAFVLPYLVPMLENAGAHVLMPRERDTQTNEVIVDNDSCTGNSIYREVGESRYFKQGGSAGFGLQRTLYIEDETPFKEGTYRSVKGTDEGTTYFEWIPDIPESGYYQVSIAYRSKAESCKDASYTIYHSGGNTEVKVNQTMGGGTWIYLGNYYFHKGLNEEFGKVVLSSKSEDEGCLVIADAVRFGGGMGNIARRPGNDTNVEIAKRKRPNRNAKVVAPYAKSSYELSGRARYLEGARYWMQWAGVPDSIYNYSYGLNDYTDDFASRGGWVNWLNGGSIYAPDSAGLGIPIDLSFAFHTDAGVRHDGVIGTLGLYTTESGDKKLGEYFPDKQSRYASRDLTDVVLSTIVDDIRTTYNSDWAYRGVRNKNYAETRRPEVPSMILELLSHQNMEDMQYALDPQFRFMVSRSIYKGILKFIATQHNIPYVVQPLPVTHLSASLSGNEVILSWQPQEDSLESSATPTGYVVYSRQGDGGFDNGIYVTDTMVRLPLPNDLAMSYQVIATNKGGSSMPSETVGAMRLTDSKGTVLVVNGFTRIAAPEAFRGGEVAGFAEWLDAGVPHGDELSYVGNQYLFDCKADWLDDDSPGWGGSYSDFEKERVKGNDFDNIHLHGSSIAAAGYSYASSSLAAIEDGNIKMEEYILVDLILGEQKATLLGRDSTDWQFKSFSLNLQSLLRNYTRYGGALLVSGAHIGSDLWHGGASNKSDQKFAEEVLKYKWRTNNASRSGVVNGVYAPKGAILGKYQFATTPNATVNAILMADGIEPVGKNAYTVMRYDDNNISAGVAYAGPYRVVALGFPIESVVDVESRHQLMQELLEFLNGKR